MNEDKLQELLEKNQQCYRVRIEERLPQTAKISIGESDIEFEKIIFHVGNQNYSLRYGTNPHMQAALYVPKKINDNFFRKLEWLKMGKDGPSATNLEDGFRGMKTCTDFDVPAVSVMKHTNPTGVAINRYGDKSLAEIFEAAWNSDSRSAFGSVVCSSVKVAEDTAKKIMEKNDSGKYKYFVECLYAPDYEDKVLEILNERKDLRIAKVPPVEKIKDLTFPYDFKNLGYSILLEDAYKTDIKTVQDLKDRYVVTQREPTEDEWKDMLYSWTVCTNKRSNGVCFWKDYRTLGIASGTPSRIDAIEDAIDIAKRMNHDLNQSVLASDAFMLWDNAEILGKEGIAAIVQPGGSIFDRKVIADANRYNIAMVFTGERCFRHF